MIRFLVKFFKMRNLLKLIKQEIIPPKYTGGKSGTHPSPSHMGNLPFFPAPRPRTIRRVNRCFVIKPLFTKLPLHSVSIDKEPRTLPLLSRGGSFSFFQSQLSKECGKCKQSFRDYVIYYL